MHCWEVFEDVTHKQILKMLGTFASKRGTFVIDRFLQLACIFMLTICYDQTSTTPELKPISPNLSNLFLKTLCLQMSKNFRIIV